MEKNILAKIEKICKPVMNLDIGTKAVWIYGSSVTKKTVEGSDIDILVIVDDTAQLDMGKIEGIIRNMHEAAKKEHLNLHFQPPRLLTAWWELVRNGEPWSITALRNSLIIYDPSGYVATMKKLLRKGELYSTEEKAERLLEIAKTRLNETREIFLERMPNEIMNAMTESAQMALMYEGRVFPAPRTIAKQLYGTFEKKGLLKRDIIEIYEDILETVEKINKGTLSEFTASDCDRLSKRAKVFILELEKLLLRLEEERRQKGMNESYHECIAMCEAALKKRLRILPKSDFEKLRLFKKNFIDTKVIDDVHYKTLKELYIYNKSKKARRKLEKEKYMSGTYVKSLKMALKGIK